MKQKKHKLYLETSETEAIENAASNLRDKLLVRLFCRVGCLVSEAVALTVHDIDLVNGTIRINNLKARKNIVCPKCRYSLRGRVCAAAVRPYTKR